MLLLGLRGGALGGGLLLEGCGRGKGFGSAAEGGGCGRHCGGEERVLEVVVVFWWWWYRRALGIASDLDFLLFYRPLFWQFACFQPKILSCDRVLYFHRYLL